MRPGAEIKYENCFSTVVGRLGGENAVFVHLKPGVAFDAKLGSYAVDQDSLIAELKRRP